MRKADKIALLIASITVVFVIGAWLLVSALWNGAFHTLHPNEIAVYQSPDGNYELVFEQVGDPEWPFGPTNVRLTLKNRDGKIIGRVSDRVFNDGVCASKQNIASVSWNDDAVIVVLRASEMQDKEVSISYP